MRHSASKSLEPEDFITSDIFSGTCDRSMGTLLASLPWKREGNNLKWLCLNQITTFYKAVTFHQHCQKRAARNSIPLREAYFFHCVDFNVVLENHKFILPRLHIHWLSLFDY